MNFNRVIINSIPDPSDPRLSSRSGGAVEDAAFDAAEQFLRIISVQQPESITASIRFQFDPSKTWQNRTNIELALCSNSMGNKQLKDLLFSGPFAGLFEFKETDSGEKTTSEASDNDYHGFSTVCDIIRREESLIAGEERREELGNDLIPEIYYSIYPFKAREENNWLLADRLLDRLTGKCMIEIMVQPIDMTEQRYQHISYLNDLIRINRSFGLDFDDGVEVARELQMNSMSSDDSDPIANEMVREHEKIQNLLRKRQLSFSIRCWSEKADDCPVLAATVAESCFEEGNYHLEFFNKADPVLQKYIETSASMKVEQDDSIGMDKAFINKKVWKTLFETYEGTSIGQNLLHITSCLSHTASVEELCSVFRLPVSYPYTSPRTFRKNTDPAVKQNSESEKFKKISVLIGDDFDMGINIFRKYEKKLDGVFQSENNRFPEIRLDTQLLKKHMFISGVPGSGKTTALFNILVQLGRLEDKVPFLVIEPAKTEYRTLKALEVHPDKRVKKLAKELKVFTIGNERVSPFRFNPLAHPEEISRDTHIDAVIACFKAAMPMYGPMEGLLAEALEYSYDHVPEGEKFPRLADVLQASRDIIDQKGYQGEFVSNIKAALDVRLGLLVRRSLGKVFDCDVGMPSGKELFEKNVVLEMDAITRDHASLMSLFVLTAMREHIQVTRKSGDRLKHVTVVEEAHNIVGNSGPAIASEDAPDSKAFAAEYISSMLAEMRALGEGIIIADQLPSAVAPEVLKNTGTKLSYRMVANDDRETIGGTMLLDKTGIQDMARLQPGEAFYFTEGLFRPRKVKTLESHIYLSFGQPPDSKGKIELPQPPDANGLIDLIQNQLWYNESKKHIVKKKLSDILYLIKQLTGIRDVLFNLVQNEPDYYLERMKAQLKESMDVRKKLEMIFREMDQITIDNRSNDIVKQRKELRSSYEILVGSFEKFLEYVDLKEQ